MSAKRNGFAPIFFLIIIAVAALVVVSTKKSSHPQVQGLELAKGDDSGSSGGSDSGSHSSDSGGSSGGSSGSSSSGDSGSKSSGSGSSTTSNTTSKSGSSEIKKSFELKNAEVEVNKPETHTIKETEDENEIENEIEAPETEKVEVHFADGLLELESKEASAAASKKLGKVQNLKLKLKQNGLEQELEVKVEGDNINIEAQNIGAETHFPLTFDKVTGQLLVTTANGQRVIRVLPAQASQIARTAGVQNQIEKIEIQANSTQGANEDVVLKLTGRKTGKILGIIDINQPVETEVGAQSGTILNTNEPFWLRLFSSLIQ